MEKQTLTRHDFFRLVGTSIGVILLTQSASACNDRSGDPAPVDEQAVDFTLLFTDKSNENLLTKGGYVVANNIIVAQTKTGEFVAVSANCTCATPGTLLTYKPTDNQFYCPQHLSRYDNTGKVIMGPATKPLVQYVTIVDKAGGSVRIRA